MDKQINNMTHLQKQTAVLDLFSVKSMPYEDEGYGFLFEPLTNDNEDLEAVHFHPEFTFARAIGLLYSVHVEEEV